MSALAESREVETKLSVPDPLQLPPLSTVAGVESVTIRTLRLRATYYDTEDLRLARSGTTLRHRTGEGRPCWTLKLDPVSGPGREELTVLGSGTAVPATLHALLTARLRGAELRQVVQLRTRRTSSLLLDAAGLELAEVVDDRVTVSDGRTWRELEVEERAGHGDVAARLLTLLQEAGASVGDQTAKAIRALGPAAAGPPDLPDPGTVRARDASAALVRWSLRDGLLRLVQHDLGVRRDVEDAVHQLRVTCRRLRSDLRTFRPLLDDPRAEQLRQELSWLADRFGAARDLEVLRERLRGTAQEPPALEITEIDALLAAQEQAALAGSLEALGSTRYLLLLQLLHDLASAPGLTPLADRRCDEVLPDLVRRTWTSLDRRLRHLANAGEDADWHRSRILAKRARYAAESAEVALGKQVRAQLRTARKVQTVLGEQQDAVIAERAVLTLALEHPALGVLCGRLAERERRQALQVRRRFLAGR